MSKFDDLLHGYFKDLIGEGDSGAVAGPEDALKSMKKKLDDKEAAGASLNPKEKGLQQKADEVDDTESAVADEIDKGATEYVNSLKQLQSDVQKAKTGKS